MTSAAFPVGAARLVRDKQTDYKRRRRKKADEEEEEEEAKMTASWPVGRKKAGNTRGFIEPVHVFNYSLY